MSTPSDLFRPEALEFWSRQAGQGGVLRVAVAWVRWLYWAVLALLAAGLVLTYFAHIELTTSGLALVDPHKSTFVAVLPAIAAADLQGQRPLRLEVTGPAGRHDVAALALHAEPVEDGDIRRAGFTSFSRPAILVTGILPPGAMSSVEVSSVRLTAQAVVVLGSKRAFVALLHGVEGAAEGGGS